MNTMQIVDVVLEVSLFDGSIPSEEVPSSVMNTDTWPWYATWERC